MRWLLPYPLLSFSLLTMWLLLNQSISVGHILLGAVLAVGAGRAMTSLEPEKPRIRFRPLAVLSLSVLVLADIVRSNIAVFYIICRPKARHGTPGFMAVPLDMRNTYGLAVLALIITSTPGTIWLNFSPASGVLLIHVLDLKDEAFWVTTIKNRYERRLMEIFE